MNTLLLIVVSFLYVELGGDAGLLMKQLGKLRQIGHAYFAGNLRNV